MTNSKRAPLRLLSQALIAAVLVSLLSCTARAADDVHFATQEDERAFDELLKNQVPVKAPSAKAEKALLHRDSDRLKDQLSQSGSGPAAARPGGPGGSLPGGGSMNPGGSSAGGGVDLPQPPRPSGAPIPSGAGGPSNPPSTRPGGH